MQTEAQLVSWLLSMLVRVLHSTEGPPSLPVEEEVRQACGQSYLWFGNLCNFHCDYHLWSPRAIPQCQHKCTNLYTIASLRCKVSPWELPPATPIAQSPWNQTIRETPAATTEKLWRSAICKQSATRVNWSQLCVSGCFWTAEGYPPYAGITEAKWMFIPGRLKL